MRQQAHGAPDGLGSQREGSSVCAEFLNDFEDLLDNDDIQ